MYAISPDPHIEPVVVSLTLAQGVVVVSVTQTVDPPPPSPELAGAAAIPLDIGGSAWPVGDPPDVGTLDHVQVVPAASHELDNVLHAAGVEAPDERGIQHDP